MDESRSDIALKVPVYQKLLRKKWTNVPSLWVVNRCIVTLLVPGDRVGRMVQDNSPHSMTPERTEQTHTTVRGGLASTFCKEDLI